MARSDGEQNRLSAEQRAALMEFTQAASDAGADPAAVLQAAIDALRTSTATSEQSEPES